MSLLALQRDMRAWLTHEDEVAAARHGANAAPGLSVYLNNYRSQLVSCLGETFAQTRRWIGDEAFDGAVATHIDRAPPSSWTLDAYPRDFPSTLAWLYPNDPEIAELAWIELALGEAFVGADAEPVASADLAEIDWDRAVLTFAPTLELGELTTNAPAIWSGLVHEDAPPAAEQLAEPGALLVWRMEQVSHFRAIDQVERQALLWARTAMPFAKLCEAMVASFGEDEGVSRSGAFLGQWLRDGLIVGVTSEP